MASLSDLMPLVQELLASGVAPEAIPDAIRSIWDRTYGGVVDLPVGQVETDRYQQGLSEAAAAQQARLTGAGGMLEFARSLANDQYQRESDPDNIVKYYAAISGLPEATSTPVQQLLGQGFELKPELANPLADPRFQALYDRMLEFTRPRNAAETVAETAQGQQAGLNQFARDQYLKDPDAFMRWTQAAAGMASGGQFTVDEPTVGIGAMSGMPKFTVAENGPEMMGNGPSGVQVTPMPGVSQDLDPETQRMMMEAVMGPHFATIAAGRTPMGKHMQGAASGLKIKGLKPSGGGSSTDAVRDAYRRDPEAAARYFGASEEARRSLAGSSGVLGDITGGITGKERGSADASNLMVIKQVNPDTGRLTYQVTVANDPRNRGKLFEVVNGRTVERALTPADISQINSTNRDYLLSRGRIGSAKRGDFTPEQVANDPDFNWIIDQYMSTGKTGVPIPANWQRSPLTDQAIANKNRFVPGAPYDQYGGRRPPLSTTIAGSEGPLPITLSPGRSARGVDGRGVTYDDLYGQQPPQGFAAGTDDVDGYATGTLGISGQRLLERYRQLLAQNMGARVGDPGYSAQYDFDKNGVINSGDQLWLAKKFGIPPVQSSIQTAPPSPPSDFPQNPLPSSQMRQRLPQRRRVTGPRLREIAGFAGGTPVDAAFDSIYKVLEKNPFVERDALDALRNRRPPPPGSLTQRFRKNVAPSIWESLQAAIRGKIGGTALGDFNQENLAYDIPGGRLGLAQWR